MTNYSNSKLSQFENCRFAYDLHYNKGYDSPYESIEAFLGSRVHETLEKLYRDLEDDRIDTLDELLDFYNRNWDEKWHDGVFNSSDKDDWTHHDDGIMCITDTTTGTIPSTSTPPPGSRPTRSSRSPTGTHGR